ncbi:MAG: hypothetical protein JNG88_10630 [Phycisphaerales bacterium]|nr:hypothetical protein [Phycisphaerales bacterium]
MIPKRARSDSKWLRGRKFRIALWLLAIFPPVLLFTTCGRWGLPSRENDDLLFGGDPAWSAERWNAGRLESARRQRQSGADTDVDPIVDRRNIVDLTATEADRAAILVRYRLYTHQPDEMITLMALARMNPREGDFDPRLYQYGGLWIYLSGAALAAMKPLLGLQFSLGANLDEPEKFAWFYVVLRGITMLFAIGLIAACQRLLLQTGSRGGALLVGPLLLFTPVFISGALEAKPHLPSACMTMFACVAAIAVLRKPTAGRAVRLSLYGGASLGLVLTGAASGALWPALLAANKRWPISRLLAHLASAGVGALLIYVVANPYLIYNSLFRPDVLASNVGNSTSMYRVGQLGAGAARVAELMVEACGWPFLIFGVLGLICMALHRPREAFVWSSPMTAMLLLTIGIGAGKPAEFGRFLLLPACAVAIGTAFLCGRRNWRISGIGIFLLLLLLPGGFRPYLRVFRDDGNRKLDSRRAAAEVINSDHSRVTRVEYHCVETSASEIPALREFVEARYSCIAVIQEPAPYSIPPIDFTHWSVLLLPRERPAQVNVKRLPQYLVFTGDDEKTHPDAWWREFYEFSSEYPRHSSTRARITWANKPVFLYALKADNVEIRRLGENDADDRSRDSAAP